MILVDVNLLLYAHDRSSPVHEATRLWLIRVLDGPEPVGFSWLGVVAFLRISTSPKIFQDPFSIEGAVKVVDYWFSQPAATLLGAGEFHWTIFRDLLLKTGIKGNLVTDAHLAAIALEHDATLLTRDRDFDQFPKLRVVNPLT